MPSSISNARHSHHIKRINHAPCDCNFVIVKARGVTIDRFNASPRGAGYEQHCRSEYASDGETAESFGHRSSGVTGAYPPGTRPGAAGGAAGWELLTSWECIGGSAPSRIGAAASRHARTPRRGAGLSAPAAADKQQHSVHHGASTVADDPAGTQIRSAMRDAGLACSRRRPRLSRKSRGGAAVSGRAASPWHLDAQVRYTLVPSSASICCRARCADLAQPGTLGPDDDAFWLASGMTRSEVRAVSVAALFDGTAIECGARHALQS